VRVGVGCSEVTEARGPYTKERKTRLDAANQSHVDMSLNSALPVGRDPGGTGDARPRLLAYARDLAGLVEVVPVHDIPGAQ
jgi:hypothetical protein